MQKHQWFLFFSILLILLIPSVLAAGNNEKILGLKGKDLGKIALIFFIAAFSILLWKPAFNWLRKNGPRLFNTEPRAFKQKLGVLYCRFMKIHNWIGLIAATVGTAHGIVLESHWTLWVGMCLIWMLVFSGSMMKWRWPPKEMRKGARLLHMQRILYFVAVILLYVGHGIVD